MQKKDRFIDTGLYIKVGQSDTFPVESFNYKNLELVLLGSSNKDDLIPVNIESIEMQKIVTFGNLKQFIYVDQTGEIYDVCLYHDKDNNIYLYAIRTREKPEKKKSK